MDPRQQTKVILELIRDLKRKTRQNDAATFVPDPDEIKVLWFLIDVAEIELAQLNKSPYLGEYLLRLELSKDHPFKPPVFRLQTPNGFFMEGDAPCVNIGHMHESEGTFNAVRATNDGTGTPGYFVEAEFSDTRHRRGIVSMARRGSPDTAGSQFFIMVDSDPQYQKVLDGQYTVFGEVIAGMEVVDRIVATQRDHRDRPLEDQVMEAVRLRPAPEPAPEPATAEE